MIDLTRALRLDEYGQAAFVGAGGKSATMFRLAAEHQGRILLSTSTHLGIEQNQLADAHIVLQSDEYFDPSKWPSEMRSVLLTGPLDTGERWTALSDDQLQALSLMAEEMGIPLLIEADGARQRYLKAPAAHEPHIPNFVDQVVVVAGLSGIGQPLSAKLVHRPERFAELADMQMREEISIDHFLQVISHEEGGLKNIPKEARRVLLLNHVEDEAGSALVKSIAPKLLSAFHAIISAAIQRSNHPINAVYERSAGIILAAGEGARFGAVKQLLEWRGETFVAHIAKTALDSGLNSVHLISGAHRQGVKQAVKGIGIHIYHNAEWQSGQASSVKSAIELLDAHVGCVLFMLVDQPQLTQTLIDALLEAHAQSLASIIVPLVDGERGNPVLFDRRTFAEFASLEGDVGGRSLFSRHRVQWLPWLDASQTIDVDTPADLNRLLNFE